jgi:Zn-dependent metalloprotease
MFISKEPGTAYDDDQVGRNEQAGHRKDFRNLSRSYDNGGVHINSGIPNHAFYLAASKIGGYAWEGAVKVWYNALESGSLRNNATLSSSLMSPCTTRGNT